MGTRPITGAHKSLRLSDLREMYKKVPAAKAKAGWERLFKESETRCMHGKKCKNFGDCDHGKRIVNYHIAVGAILPAFKNIEKALKEGKKTGRSKKVRIVRATL